MKKVADDSEGGGGGGVHIEMTQHVNLTFSLKYLVNFSKSASLSDTVQLMLKNDVPLLVRTPCNLRKLSCSHRCFTRCRTHSVRAISGTIWHLRSVTTEHRVALNHRIISET